MARIFITGGGGFIGRTVIPMLLAQGHSVLALQRNSRIIPAEHPLLSVVHGNLQNISGSIRKHVHGCDTLLHLAGDTTPALSATNFQLEVETNLWPLLQLLDTLRGATVKRVVIVSSGGMVYGRSKSLLIDEDHPTIPTTPYGLGKLTVEHLTRFWAEENGVQWTLLRVANGYGPHQAGRNNQGVIGVWLQRVLNHQPLLIWGDGSAVRDYVYVADLAKALTIACLQPRLASGIYNIGSEQGVGLLDVAAAISQVTGLKPDIQFTPAKSYEISTNVLSSAKFRSATGWHTTTPLSDGIRLTYDFVTRMRE